MPVKIRLSRKGRRKKPYYHIVIADARAPRDGKFIENIGFYNPNTVPATIEIDREKAYEWLMKGAQPTNTAKAIMKFKGVYYRKHLMRGVAKGALSEEKATEMYNAWIEAKEAKIAARVEETKKKKAEFWKMVSGEIQAVKPKADKEAGDAFRETEVTEGGEATEEAAPEAPAAKAVAPEAPAPEAPEPTPTPEPEAKEPEPAPVVEEKVEAAAPTPEPASEVKPDDLTKIEGIGPAIAKLLGAAGVITFSDLAAKSADDVKAVLTEAGSRFQMHDPSTWGKQADMAAKGEWDALKKWQDELDGGKPAASSEEE